MDLSSPMRHSKSQKLNVEYDTNGNGKSLNNLPDVILHRILSLMPTKDAVQTCILSKKWQNQWMSISKFHFMEVSSSARKPFMNFVERVLLLRDFMNIEKFSLSCFVLDDGSRIDGWISSAIKHNVQELYIFLRSFQQPFVLPHCLFTSETLTSLDISMHYKLKLPPSICLSRLKLLTLTEIIFPDDHSTQQLFSGCPVLEELCIDYCSWENLHAVSICAPMLSKLTISELDWQAHHGSNSNGCLVMIFGRCLKSLDYTGEFSNDYCLCNTSVLLKASISLNIWSQEPRQREVAYRANKLLRGASNVKDLYITGGCFKVFDNAKELIPHMPTYSNLTNLEVNGMIDFGCETVRNMFQTFPCLKSLVFLEDICISAANCKLDGWSLDPMPPCFLAHLEYIRIESFYGHEDDIVLVRIFLEHAKVLNEMVICCYCSSDLPEKVKEQVLNFPRASVSCSVVI